MLDFWKRRHSNWGTVKTSRTGSGNETASYLESINVSGMCFNSVHLHVHMVMCFAGSLKCTVLVSPFLPENKEEGRKNTSDKKQGGFVSCTSCQSHVFF